MAGKYQWQSETHLPQEEHEVPCPPGTAVLVLELSLAPLEWQDDSLGSLYISGFIHSLKNKLPRASPPSSLVAFLPGAFDGLPVLTGPLLKSPVFAHLSLGCPPTPWLSPHHGCTSPCTAENQLSLAGSVVAAEGQGQGHA